MHFSIYKIFYFYLKSDLNNCDVNIPFGKKIEDFVEVTCSPSLAAKNAHAIVICTEWDEFKVLILNKFNLI